MRLVHNEALAHWMQRQMARRKLLYCCSAAQRNEQWVWPLWSACAHAWLGSQEEVVDGTGRDGTRERAGELQTVLLVGSGH